MDKVFVENYDQMSEEGFEQIKEVIETVDNPVLSINRGGTPRGLYKKLVEAVNNGLDISETNVYIALDIFVRDRVIISFNLNVVV